MKNTITVNFGVPPGDAAVSQAMPVFATACAVLSFICLIFAVKHTLKYKTPMPIIMVIAGFCSIPMEAIVCHLGHCWHPVVGQNTLYNSLGISVPLWLFFGYCFYFAGPYMAAFSRIANNSFTSKEVWIGFFGAVIGAMIIEIYAVHNHVWIYYDHQALWFWKSTIPVTWAFINATCVFVPLTAIKFLFPILIGWKQWLIIVLSPMFAIMGHLGAGFPFYLVNNSAASSNRGLMDLSGVASILMSLLLIFICNKVLTFKQQIS